MCGAVVFSEWFRVSGLMEHIEFRLAAGLKATLTQRWD